MNKETKIGLLTGLGVIVIIGVLLSEYLGQPGAGTTMANAALSNLGAPYRQQIMNPIGVPAVVNPDNAASAPATANNDPTTPLASGQSIANASLNGPGVPAMVGVAALGTPVVRPLTDDQTALTGDNASAATLATAPLPIDHQIQPAVFVPGNTPTAPAFNAGNALGGDRGVTLVAAGNMPARGPVASACESYTVTHGDTLTGIAKKFYHSASRANQSKIIAANPGVLKSFASALRIGMKLQIPDGPQAGATAPATALPAQAAAHTGRMLIAVPGVKTARTPMVNVNAVRATGKTYTVQKGDTLSRIARKTLGSASRSNMLKIAKLNGIALSDALDIGQVLHLPVK